MPIIQAEVYGFVRLWNVHRIRKQPKRPNCVFGQPSTNYFYPKEGIRNYALKPPSRLFSAMQKDVAEWGILLSIMYY